MINAIWVVAHTTFKESIRDRILLTLGVFTLLLLGSTLFLGTISLDQDSKIIIDFGLFGIFFFGVLVTLFLGASTIIRELDQRTAYTILARPLKRWWYIVGKFFGLALTLLTLTLLESAVFLGLVVWKLGLGGINSALVLALFYVFLEFCVLISMMLFFSSFATSVMSTIYGFALFLIGHSMPSIVALATQMQSAARFIFVPIYYVFPNLEKFNLRNDAVYNLRPGEIEVALTFGYAVLYICILLYLANLIFRKQEL